jgi:hypothetical protein
MDLGFLIRRRKRIGFGLEFLELSALTPSAEQAIRTPTDATVYGFGGARCQAHNRAVLPSLRRSKSAADCPTVKGSRLPQPFRHVHPALCRRRAVEGFIAGPSGRTQSATSDRPSSGNQDRKKCYRRFTARDGA